LQPAFAPQKSGRVSRPTLFRTAVARLLGSALALLLTAGLPAIGAVPARAATHVVPSRTAAFEADLLVQINCVKRTVSHR
jgi:hypothetical protein